VVVKTAREEIEKKTGRKTANRMLENMRAGRISQMDGCIRISLSIP
jgi:hypothetical protein